MNLDLTIVAAAATSLLSAACTDAAFKARSADPPPICYASPDGRLVRSTLSVVRESGDRERLLGVTDLRTGRRGEQLAAANTARVAARADDEGIVRVVERAELDATGRLLRLEARVGAPGTEPDTRVVLDPPNGSVRITSPSLNIDWSVSNDLPWIWAPLLTAPGGGTITTPLVARVVLRAASSDRPVRLIDLGALTSHSITADQLVIPDGDRATVIVADDAVDVSGGVPGAIHLAALGTTLRPSTRVTQKRRWLRHASRARRSITDDPRC
jgi:hypothetical protein